LKEAQKMSNSSVLASLFKYKSWSNDEILTAIAKVDAEKNPTERHAAIRLINHTYVVDRIFAAHLTRQPHVYAATNTPETPTLDELRMAIGVSDGWYENYVSKLSAQELSEQINFKFTDGDAGTMSREEILLHVITHGGYHRGAAGRILAQLEIAPPRDLFTRYLHNTEPSRRAAGL
jgi:uncharacterized damage-inducible protein DinB